MNTRAKAIERTRKQRAHARELKQRAAWHRAVTQLRARRKIGHSQARLRKQVSRGKQRALQAREKARRAGQVARDRGRAARRRAGAARDRAARQARSHRS